MQYTLTRTGDSPLIVDGELIGEAGGERPAERERTRYHELRLYRAGERYVCEIVFLTHWDGEYDHATAIVCDSADAVREALRSYEPVLPGVGYPPGEQFEKRQLRLEAELREQYDQAVSELLAADEFAQRVEDVEGSQCDRCGAFVSDLDTGFSLAAHGMRCPCGGRWKASVR